MSAAGPSINQNRGLGVGIKDSPHPPRAHQGGSPRPFMRFNHADHGGPGEFSEGEDEDEESNVGSGRRRIRRPRRRSLSERGGWKTSNDFKNDLLATAGEFVGTFLFLFMAFIGAQSAQYNKGSSADNSITTTDNQTILFIALSFGMSLLVVAWAFFRITGAAFNPAVTLSLWFIGSLTSRRAVLVVVAQLIGGISAAGVAKGLVIGSFAVENSLTDGISNAQGTFIEMFTTGMLCFTVMMTAAEKHKSTFLAPVAIGLSVFVGHLASVGWTGTGMNPARSLAPSVVNGHFVGDAWIYYVGQFLGSLLATAIYVALKHLHYHEVVHGIDTDVVKQSQDVTEAPVFTAFAKLQATTSNPSRSSAERTRSSDSTMRDPEQQGMGPTAFMGEGPVVEEPKAMKEVA
ncbi:aquaporin-like protein [Meredithblackwellia eburnea MCA 4105]